MNRTARNHNTDLWGKATGLPTNYVGNTMNLNNNEQTIKTNTAPDYGETIHKPRGGKVVEDDKKLQLGRQKENDKQRKLQILRFEKNITDARTNYYGTDAVLRK